MMRVSGSRPPRVLLVTFNRLMPADQGNARRIMQLVRLYEGLGCTVDVLYHAEEGLDPGLSRALQQRFGLVRCVSSKASKRIGADHVCRLADWYDPQLPAVAQEMHRLRDYQVVHVNYIWYAPLLAHFGPTVVKVLDSHDVFADRAEAYRQAGLTPAWFSTTRAEEDRAFRLADAVLAIQRDEARAMAARGHPNILFLPYLEPQEQPFGPRGTTGPLVLGYLGSGNDWNIRSLRAFLQAWQGRGDRLPVQLLVAGGICRHLADQPGVAKMGFVQELQTFYGAIDVAINPMVGGTGLKIKTVEPLSFGRPVLSTPAGIQGLGEVWQLPVSASAEALAADLCLWLAEPRQAWLDGLLAQAAATRQALDAEFEAQRARLARWLSRRLAGAQTV